MLISNTISTTLDNGGLKLQLIGVVHRRFLHLLLRTQYLKAESCIVCKISVDLYLCNFFLFLSTLDNPQFVYFVFQINFITYKIFKNNTKDKYTLLQLYKYLNCIYTQ